MVHVSIKVVAYTRSKLHFAMLSLFLDLRTRLPNVIIGVITRESMRRALATGIKGRQVLDFLKCHAHPVVRRRSPVVPENIADQVCHNSRLESSIPSLSLKNRGCLRFLL